MMFPRQPFDGHICEHGANDATQCVLGQKIVAEVVDRHGGLSKKKWGLLLPGAPEPRLTLLRRQDFKIGFSNRLRGLSNRSIVVVGNYCSGPITAEPYRAKARPLRPRRSYFAPVPSVISSAIRTLLQ